VSTAKKIAVAASFIGFVLSAPSALATSCGTVPVPKRELKASHIVASGKIAVLSKEVQDLGDGISLIKGTAELHVESIIRNRTSLVAPFRFTFQYRFDGGCAFGDLVYDGESAIVHLKRPSRQAKVLTVVNVDYP
jgi:hypothetical protein